MVIELLGEIVILNTSYIGIIEIDMPKAVFFSPNFHYLALSMMVKKLGHIIVVT
jgi:hypothetical protein